ncbi:single-stranded DNA-binding protein [Metamycoplasma canadense]|uniref:Single-stranded DNA-binding protein n=1 Tax=Metamycoplasma canadense TaxID=29554 RepID=A0A077LBU7_9BACT|nr:single-stranded DNA-binding protein [Metamycoplasma canadense]BAP39599.1 single-strand binding protein [Metamycoplasma canadense]
MNKVILLGRLVSKPYKGLAGSGIEYSRFTIAVTRSYSAPNAEPVSDFIPCIAWRSNATFINKYLDKGSLLFIEGSFQSSRFTDANGQAINNYVVSIEKIKSLESKEITEARRKNNSKEFSISNEESKDIIENQKFIEANQPEDTDVYDDGLVWDNM